MIRTRNSILHAQLKACISKTERKRGQSQIGLGMKLNSEKGLDSRTCVVCLIIHT